MLSETTASQWLTVLLRLIGTSSLLAILFVAAPGGWMKSIHAALGMGELPDAPVVWYLARSTSALYALLGGLFWVVSLDLRRHRRVLGYIGPAVVALGVALTLIDWIEDLPLFWKVWEGPFVIAFGVTVTVLTRAIPDA